MSDRLPFASAILCVTPFRKLSTSCGDTIFTKEALKVPELLDLKFILWPFTIDNLSAVDIACHGQ